MTDPKHPTETLNNSGFRAAASTAPSAVPSAIPRSTHTDTPLITVQPVKRGELQPSYAQNLGVRDDDAGDGIYGAFIDGLGTCIGFFGAIPCCFIWYISLFQSFPSIAFLTFPSPNPYKPVSQGNVGLVTKFGRFYRAVDPGLVKINPLSERLIQIDVKIQLCEVPQQVCMTKDNVTVHLTSVIYYHVVSPHKAAFGISNVRQALIERTQTTLRHVVGARVLQDVIERREEVAQSISEIIGDVAEGWGVQVESMLIKDIIFSRELQDSLSMAAQSKRIGESKIIAARAEVEAAKLMRQAADILSSAPAMQIRQLEAYQAMAKSANSKVIFVPTNNTTLSGSSFSKNGGEGSSKDAESGGFGTSYHQALNAHIASEL
ncbi:stomatin family protein-like protein [Wilcoxina mikolae CBS 423.85]|nr:stomatin family protein-like protein [Wilcoxina mikolae CBS 423.85]